MPLRAYEDSVMFYVFCEQPPLACFARSQPHERRTCARYSSVHSRLTDEAHRIVAFVARMLSSSLHFAELIRANKRSCVLVLANWKMTMISVRCHQNGYTYVIFMLLLSCCCSVLSPKAACCLWARKFTDCPHTRARRTDRTHNTHNGTLFWLNNYIVHMHSRARECVPHTYCLLRTRAH